ncbi:MAG: ABC transporter ATP-binding protein [Synergistaceae bacterium]|jgi:simple sugar transport system ATP-binding protein|nr:ABC transporter ATP-binding protein [Synergistaceae bacterium]
MEYAVEMERITKRYPGVLANDDVSLCVGAGEIHGLIGENGAGKSTLMNILYGLELPDSGVIRVFGREAAIGSPNAAIRLGISMVHQHFMLMPNMTVLQNIILGRAPTRFGFIDRAKAREAISDIIDRYDLAVDLDLKIYQLSVGQKQRVEIIKALYRRAKILVLDEPTAVLTPDETNRLMSVLRRLKEQGISIIFITHKLREVMEVSDMITVMRKGAVTGRVKGAEASAGSLSTMMVGRIVDMSVPKAERKPAEEPIVEIDCLHALNSRGLPALRGVSFRIFPGEIVGVAGVEGNGQTELIEVISGLSRPLSGSVRFMGLDVTHMPVRPRRELGMAHVPEDRLKQGVAASCSIRDNLVLGCYYRPPYSKLGVMDNNRLSGLAERLREDFDIKAPGTGGLLGTLSGGNMQKVVFARETHDSPKFLIAAQPTRGVDIGAIEYIRRRIMRLRDEGSAILLVSAELDEILSLSDRILVMYEGEIAAEVDGNCADEDEIGQFMMGARRKGHSDA